LQPALEKDTGDPAALEKVGMFFCLQKGAWPAGVRLLARGAGKDAELKSLAERDLKRPETSQDRLQLAAAYGAYSEKAEGAAKIETARRAVHWYRAALPGVPAADAKKARDELRRLTKLPGFRPLEVAGSYRRFGQLAGGLQMMALSSDGLWVVASGKDSKLTVWDAETRTVTQQIKRPDRGPMHCLAFSRSGQKFVTCEDRAAITVWDRKDGMRDGAYRPNIIPVHFVGWLNKDVLLTAGDGDWFQRASPDENGETFHVALPRARIHSLAASPDGNLIALGLTNGATELQTGERPVLVRTLPAAGRTVSALAFAGDFRHLVAAYEQGPMLLWTIEATGRQPKPIIVSKAPGEVGLLAVSADTRRVLWTTGGSSVHVADTRLRKEVVRLECESTVRGLAFLPDGFHAITAEDNGTLLVWVLPHERD